MPQKQTYLNTSQTETGANTIKSSQVEVPGSEGAKQVIMQSARITVQTPDASAAAWTEVRGAVSVGKQTPTNLLPSEVGQVVEKMQKLYSAAGPAPVMIHDEAGGVLESPVNITPDQATGKFYITLGVLGVGCSAAKTGYFALRFIVSS